MKAYVKIMFFGSSPERFLNMCKHKNISIWNLQYKEKLFECCMLAKDFKKIKSIAKKSKIKIRIIEKHGTNFILFQYRKRTIFYIGIMLVFIIMIYGTSRIWHIDINGNRAITDDVLYEYLRENNIYIGIREKQVDCDRICKMLRRDFPQIIWVSTSLEGTKMSIDIRENTDIFSVQEDAPVYQDIVSNIDGVVTSIVTREGTPLVKVGDEIRQGDVLVSGKIEIKNDAGEVVQEQFVAADADIYIKHQISYKESCENTYDVKHYCGAKNRIISLQFFSHKLELGFMGKSNLYEIRTYQKQITPFFSITMKNRQEYELEKFKYKIEEQKMILRSSFEKYISELKNSNIEVLSEDMKYINGHDEILYVGNIEVIQQVLDLY